MLFLAIVLCLLLNSYEAEKRQSFDTDGTTSSVWVIGLQYLKEKTAVRTSCRTPKQVVVNKKFCA